MKILGDLGEKIYANHCSSLGHKIHLSLNPFDMEKDILVDDKRKEIKIIPDMLNLLGCKKEIFVKLLKLMNYKTF